MQCDRKRLRHICRRQRLGIMAALDYKMSIKFGLEDGYASTTLRGVLHQGDKEIYKTETKLMPDTS